MEISHTTLFESIRSKCQRERWFGPDMRNPRQYEEIPLYDMNLVFLTPPDDRQPIPATAFVPVDDPNRFGFGFPAASEQLLYTTEARLGFALPLLLRELYMHLANGGFGPGAGLRGALEGYGRRGSFPRPDEDETIVGSYLFESRERTVELAQCEGWQTGEQRWVLPYGTWPAGLLPLCDLGCMQEICIDGREQVFLVAPTEDNALYSLTRLSCDFAAWLWRWLHDEDLVPHIRRESATGG